MKRKPNLYADFVNRFLDQGVDEDIAMIKASIAVEDALEIQKPDQYSPLVVDKDWDFLNVMLSVSKMIQLRALKHMKSSRALSFKPHVVLSALKRNPKYTELFKMVNDKWAIHQVKYAKGNHELALRREITHEEAKRRATSCIWYEGCEGLDIDFNSSTINVLTPDGKGTLAIPVKGIKRRDTLRNIKVEREGTTTHGLQLTFHHHDDVKHESPYMQKLMKDALAETRKVSENRNLVDIIVTLDDEEEAK